MAEMSLERACEVLNEFEYTGAANWRIGDYETEGWPIKPGERYAYRGDTIWHPEWLTIAVAEKLLRDAAAPPAERAGGSEAPPASTLGRLPDAVAAIRGLVDGAGDDDLVGLYSQSHGPRNICLHAGTLRALADAAGRLDAGQLSGDSGQLGEMIAHLRILLGLASDGRAIQVRVGYGEASFTADDLRALLAAAERGRPASDLRSQVLALAELKPGWYDGEGEAYDPKQLTAVADALDRLVGLAGANAYPMPNGRISVEWHAGPRSDSLEIDPQTLAMRMHLYDLGSGEAVVGEIAPESLLAARRPPVSEPWALGFAHGLRDDCPGPDSFWEHGDEFSAGFDAARAIKGRLAEPGPATRRVMNILAELIRDVGPGAVRASLDDRCRWLPRTDIAGALTELNMEPPR